MQVITWKNIHEHPIMWTVAFKLTITWNGAIVYLYVLWLKYIIDRLTKCILLASYVTLKRMQANCWSDSSVIPKLKLNAQVICVTQTILWEVVNWVIHSAKMCGIQKTVMEIYLVFKLFQQKININHARSVLQNAFITMLLASCSYN